MSHDLKPLLQRLIDNAAGDAPSADEFEAVGAAVAAGAVGEAQLAALLAPSDVVA